MQPCRWVQGSLEGRRALRVWAGSEGGCGHRDARAVGPRRRLVYQSGEQMGHLVLSLRAGDGGPDCWSRRGCGSGVWGGRYSGPICLQVQPSLFPSTFKKHLTILNTCLMNNECVCEKEGKGPQSFKKFCLKVLVTIALRGEHLEPALLGDVQVYETELVATVTELYLSRCES